MLDLPGVRGGGTLGKNSAEQERPYPAALSGKDRAYNLEPEAGTFGFLSPRSEGRPEG
jgi:hypothetical protein